MNEVRLTISFANVVMFDALKAVTLMPAVMVYLCVRVCVCECMQRVKRVKL